MTLTTREKRAIAYAAVAAWCFYPSKKKRSKWISTAGYVAVGLLAADAVAWAKDSKLLSNPDTMNAYFRSGGKVTGQSNPAGAALVRKTGVVA